jgi:hypothetical protein
VRKKQTTNITLNETGQQPPAHSSINHSTELLHHKDKQHKGQRVHLSQATGATKKLDGAPFTKIENRIEEMQ